MPPASVKSVSINAMAKNGDSTAVGGANKSEAEDVEQGIDPGWNTPVTDELLRNAWLEYATTVQVKNPYLYTILANHVPKLAGNGIDLLLGLKNPMQETEIMKEKAVLFIFLKRQLKNAKLTLSVQIVEEESTVTKAYTASDKLKVMMDQNPSLADLKKFFDLDLE